MHESALFLYSGGYKEIHEKIKTLMELYEKDKELIKIQNLEKEIPEEITKLDKELNENEVLINLKQRYPIAFEFLINMRNLYIANQILKAEKANPYKKILIFLGKGHVKQVEEMINWKIG